MKRGIYFDTTNGDMWYQLSADPENPRWRWVNGGGWVKAPTRNLEYDGELPDWIT